jgi:1-acyl-sn-glycerol-3-phosphate acyltransferase
MLLQCQVGRRNHRAGWSVSGRFRIASDEVLYHLGRFMVRLCAPFLFRLDVSCQTPLPRGPKIIAPNHPSTTDPFLITGLIPEPTSILIDDRLFKVPVFGRYLTQVSHVPVDQSKGRKAFEAARQLLGDGRNVAIFPEGSVSPLEGGFHQPRTGMARLALLTGAPVIPIGIYLDRERVRVVESRYSGISATGRWYLSGPYAMTVGEPVYLNGDVKDREYVRVASERIMQHIAWLAYQSALRVEASRSLKSRLEPGRIGLVKVGTGELIG